MNRELLKKIFGWYYTIKSRQFAGVGLSVFISLFFISDTIIENFSNLYLVNFVLLGIFYLGAPLIEWPNIQRLRGSIFFLLNLILGYNYMSVGYLLVSNSIQNISTELVMNTALYFFITALHPLILMYSEKIENLFVRFLLFLLPIAFLVRPIWIFYTDAQKYLF